MLTRSCPSVTQRATGQSHGGVASSKVRENCNPTLHVQGRREPEADLILHDPIGAGHSRDRE